MRNHLIYCLVLFTLWSSCTIKTESPDLQPVKFTVSPAEDWTALFNRTSGWFGGDGIFAIPFSGKDTGYSNDSILFLFSDTMVGEIDNGVLQPGYTMINNSCMILRGTEPNSSNAEFLVNADGEGKPSSLFVPKTAGAGKDDYYWLGDGFVNADFDSALYIFAYRIRNTNDGSIFPFREVGNALLIIRKGEKYPFTSHRQVELPFQSAKDSLTTPFGVGVFQNTTSTGDADADGYIYVYGVRGKNKELLAARTKPADVENFSKWEFHASGSWVNNYDGAQPIADSVSNELSVTKIAERKYALIYQYAGLMPTIYMQVGPSPTGPFGPRQKVWSTADDVKEKDLFAYNAKAHPAISKPGELLISYNVNSFNFFEQIKVIPNLYRPRFVRITFDEESLN